MSINLIVFFQVYKSICEFEKALNRKIEGKTKKTEKRKIETIAINICYNKNNI